MQASDRVDRHERGPRDRRGHARRGAQRRARDRRVPRDARRERRRARSSTTLHAGYDERRSCSAACRCGADVRARSCRDRAERRRQVDVPQGGLRGRPPDERLRRVRRRRRDGIAARPHHPARARLRPPARQRLPQPDGLGEPRRRRPGAGARRPSRRGCRGRRAVPAPARAPPTARGHALRRSAQAPRPRARARRPAVAALLDEPSAGLSPRATDMVFARARGHPRPRHRDRHGRAERAPRARARGPRLRARHGPERARGHGRRPARRHARRRALPRRR